MTRFCNYPHANHATDLIALLYSRLATLCTAFDISASSSVSDPSIVPLLVAGQTEASTNITAVSRSQGFVTLLLRPIDLANRGTAAPSGPGLAYLQRGTKFYKLFYLYNDLSLREGLYFTDPGFPALKVEAPDRKSRMDTTRSSTRVWEDNWIIADELADDDSNEHCSWMVQSTRHLPHAVRKRMEPGQEEQWTVNLEWLHEELERSLTTRSGSETSKLRNAKSFEDCLEVLGAAIREMSAKGQQGMESL